MKKSCIVCLLVLLVILTANCNLPYKSNADNEIEVLRITTVSESLQDELLIDYNEFYKKHPGWTIKMDGLKSSEKVGYDTLAKKLIDPKSIWDIAIVNTDVVSVLVSSGVIFDMSEDEIIHKNTNKMFSSLVGTNQFNGKMFYLPLIYSPNQPIIISAKYSKTYSLSAKDFLTWDQILDFNREYKLKVTDGLIPVLMNREYGIWLLNDYAVNNLKDNRLDFMSSEGMYLLSITKRIYNEIPDIKDVEWTKPSNDYIRSGKAIIGIHGSWEWGPDDGTLIFAPTPCIDKNLKIPMISGVLSLVINRNTERLDEAIDYARVSSDCIFYDSCTEDNVPFRASVDYRFPSVVGVYDTMNICEALVLKDQTNRSVANYNYGGFIQKNYDEIKTSLRKYWQGKVSVEDTAQKLNNIFNRKK